MQANRKNNQKNSLIFQQFINHCATVIQSNFKAYMQRKRYKQFLPIYRRLREILLAGFQGWKTRRILKMQKIKNQILQIKAMRNKNLVSKVRIAKRQLIDQIERVKKKGRWIELVFNERKVLSIKKQSIKQNSSLYGNVKAKSIKNIFKNHPRNIVNEGQSWKVLKKNQKTLPQTSRTAQKQIRTVNLYEQSNINCHDEIKLNKPKDFNQLLQENLLKCNNSYQEPKKYKKPREKHLKDKNCLKQVQKKTKDTQEDEDFMKKSEKFQTFNSVISINTFDSQNKVGNKKKLKITLTKSLKESKVSQSKLLNKNDKEETEIMVFEQRKIKSSNLCSVLRQYNSTYREKREQLKEKLKESFTNSSCISIFQSSH